MFNHAYELAFEVLSDQEDSDKIPVEAIIKGLEKRLQSFKDDHTQARMACQQYDCYFDADG